MPYKDPVLRKKKSGERWREWTERNPQSARNRTSKWQKANVEYFLYYSAKRRARRDGVPFELDRDDIPPVPAVCPVLGIPIFQKPGGKGPCENSPTLDKIDNKRGYVPGNVAVISFRANRLKADMTINELKLILNYMEN